MTNGDIADLLFIDEDELNEVLSQLTGWGDWVQDPDDGSFTRVNWEGSPVLAEAKAAIQSLIRTEKLKLLDRISRHQEDLFWWTGGEYEKTKAVDMRAIASEREQLTKLEAEL